MNARPKKSPLASAFTHLAMLTAGLASVSTPANADDYQRDRDLLRAHTPIVELVRGDLRIAVAPAYQGRVMTSTAAGLQGRSFGWINPPVIAAGIKPEAERNGLARHIHVFGGEERLWFGPEGGPFSLFFAPRVPQEFADWRTPAEIDTEPLPTVGEPEAERVVFGRRMTLKNRAGTVLDMEVRREVRLSGAEALKDRVDHADTSDLRVVGYTTVNTVKNVGSQPWTRASGAPSIWLLGMFRPSERTTMLFPFRTGPESELGPIANTTYFGPIPPDRVVAKDGVLYFKGDGKQRGKLGLTSRRTPGIAGSWQADTGVLTLLFASPAKGPASAWPFVDSQWREDVDPFGGDLINAYNDGPPEPGAAPLGPFYELESSSPALLLGPGESHTHTQTTLHLTGPREALDRVARRVFGVGLTSIENALP